MFELAQSTSFAQPASILSLVTCPRQLSSPLKSASFESVAVIKSLTTLPLLVVRTHSRVQFLFSSLRALCPVSPLAWSLCCSSRSSGSSRNHNPSPAFLGFSVLFSRFSPAVRVLGVHRMVRVVLIVVFQEETSQRGAIKLGFVMTASHMILLGF